MVEFGVNYYYGDIISHRLSDCTLESFDWSGNLSLKIYLKNLVKNKIWNKGVGLVGGTGVGKTHLLIALYKERMYRAIYEDGVVPVWVSFGDLLDLYKNKDEFKEIVSRRLLFVDDLFYDGQGQDELKVVKDLVFRLYDVGGVLNWTSNILWEHIDLDERVRSRLLQLSEVFEVFGRDRRR